MLIDSRSHCSTTRSPTHSLRVLSLYPIASALLAESILPRPRFVPLPHLPHVLPLIRRAVKRRLEKVLDEEAGHGVGEEYGAASAHDDEEDDDLRRVD